MRQLIALTLALVLALGGAAIAQPGACALGDDGFNLGACCMIPQPNLPNFPGIQVDGRWGCIRACSLEADYLMNVQLSPPNFVTCDQALIQTSLMPGAPGAPTFSGMLLAKYVRTWTQLSSTGAIGNQVWRFTVNGELAALPTSVSAGIPCPIPPSVGPNFQRPIHVWGSIDYICAGITSTGAPAWRVRMDLTHGPGCLQHAPWTTAPLTGAAAHNDRSYHLVAPSAFMWLASAEPQGGLLGESARESRFNPVTGNYQCFTEARATQGFMNTVQSNCLCMNLTPVVGPWKHQDLNASIACAGTVSPVNNLPLPGTPFPTGLVGLTLGRYISTTSTAVGEELTVYWGVFQYATQCTTQVPIHVVHGVATRGQPGILFNMGPAAMPMMQFIDFQNHKPLQTITTGLPGFGSIALADQVWSFNMP